MSIFEIQEMVTEGRLDNALSYLTKNYQDQHFEKEIYESIIHLRKGELTPALDSAIRAHDIAKLTGTGDNHQSAHVAMAYALLKLGKLDEANYYVKLARKGFSDYQINSHDISFYWYRNLYLVTGGICTRNGETQKAIEAYRKCLDISLISDNKGLRAEVYNNLGYANNLIGKSEEAFEYYSKSLEVFEELENEPYMYYPLSNIGIYYYNKGDMINSEKYHSQALTIAKKIGNKPNIASQYRDMSQIYRYHGDTQKALKYLQDSLDLREEIGNPIWLTFTLIYMIEISIEQNNSELANQCYSRLKEINIELKTNKLVDQTTRMAQALILKSQPRIRPKSEAIVIFKQMISEDVIDFDMTINAILHLCELLLFEIKLTQEEDVLIEIHSLSAKLIQIAEMNNSHLLIGEVLGLQANLAIIDGNYKHALHLYDEALKLANQFDSMKLKNKLKDLKQLLINESEMWANLTNGNNPIVKRIQKSNIEAYLKEIIKMKDNLSKK